MARNEPGVGLALTDTVLRSLALDAASLQPVAAAQTPLTGSLTESARQCLQDLRVRPETVAAALGLDRATVRRMSLPHTSQQNLDRMVRFEADRYIPFPLEAVELDYQVRPDHGSDRLEVAVAAVRKDDATQLAHALGGATGAPVILDTVGTALLAAWQQKHGDVSEAALVVDLSGQHASLVVCESGHLVLARSAPTGVDALRVALAEDLQVTLDEAEAARRSQGVVGLEAGPPALGAASEAPDREAAAAWLTRLAQEIRRTLEAFRSQRSGLQRCSVTVTGEGADTPGLPAALEWAIGQSVSVFDPLADSPLVLPAPGHCFTVAYGLALRALGRSPVSLDLAPKAERAGRRRRRERVLWIGAAALLAVAVVAGYVYASGRLRAVEAEAGQVRDEVRRLQRQIGDVNVALASAAAVGDIDELLADLTKTESRPLEVLREVSVSLPGGLWLTDMLYDRERGLTLHGQALDSVSVTDAVGILSRKPYLSEVKLSAINIVAIGDRSVYEFDITAAFEAPEASTKSSAERETSRRRS